MPAEIISSATMRLMSVMRSLMRWRCWSKGFAVGIGAAGDRLAPERVENLQLLVVMADGSLLDLYALERVL